ncbi:MAG TPA: hypothetical protein VJ846_10865 [Sphingomicrobium sp.]|nr:hypothetical protein [Sphingomicrobium sp.]
MLTEQFNPVDRIEVNSDGSIGVREATTVLRDGVVAFSPTYHRYVLHPGDDLTGKDDRIIAVAKAVWTEEIIKTYQAAVADRPAI